MVINSYLTCLQSRLERTEANEGGNEGGQDRVDGGKDGPAVAAGNQELRYGSDDEDGWLVPDLGQGVVERRHRDAVDDLGLLHSLPRSNVHADHVPTNIGIPNDGEKSAHRHSAR